MAGVNELNELMTRKEELHPDLVPWINDVSFGKALQHPLVYSLIYDTQLNAILNAQYAHKVKYAAEAKSEKNWSSYIWIHERPYRLEKFLEIQSDLSDEEYWKLLGEIWADSENLWQYDAILDYVIDNPRRLTGREAMMNDEEIEFLNNLPEKFIIYRGHQIRNRKGYSWTLSYWRAKWFSKRFYDPKAGVVQAIVNKKDIIAVLLGRGEFEIVVSPNKLTISTIKKTKRPSWLEELAKEFEETFSQGGLTPYRSYHGPVHWEKVEKNAIYLASRTKKADKKVVRLFALIHDCQRQNENYDPEHGHRAAAYAEQLFEQGKLDINKKQLEILMEACKFHNDGLVSNDPTIGVCWDADRLDLTRVGIIPNPDLLSTTAAKEFLWKI